MNNFNQPYLEKYTGKASRHKCPKCGDPHSFAYYLDGNTGQVIDKNVGRCNHESGCGYHYTPKQFFIDNPVEKERFAVPTQQKPMQKPQREIGYIPFRYVEKSASYNSFFVYFLCGLFDRYSLEFPTIERLMQDYALGATKDGSVIYWQIDTQGKVRTGKVMKYDPNTGHRIKSGGGINWIHAIMKKQQLLPEDYNLVQCLFGEHLLRMYPTKVVALVESEKSALIASGVYPDYIWLATGGKSQISIDKLKVLRGRTVIMFPDVDGFEYWSNKAKEVEAIGCKVVVSDLLEKNAADEDRANKIDLADWLIRNLSVETMKEIRHELSEAEKTLQAMIEANPALQLLIDTFDLKLIA
ncbi:DUF6371 domain-containing protein [uncultured Parabacteroides sp.]|jgi:hypothetical protein|uniref:DUF6371 domain-containing protein n=1 Tax=uncultured Parabacteroides sp. TaxID=512312 RepID=UPI0025EF643F|nr:DUF6371 domain-containing protein [uncultured Parabacteroides sp.]